IKANIVIPITEGSEVVALLNVDSFSSESAFSSNSLRIAEAFAQHIAVIVRQVEQVRRLEESLVTDVLTRLGNREGFQRRLQAELARAERYGHPLNLVMVDLDNFKQINDRFGHAAGDAALVAVAESLTSHLRSSDHAFRWAGDEFVLLLPEVKPEEAHAAAERFAELVTRIEVHGVGLSASVGVASYPVDGHDPETLLRRADDLMYFRKQRGRAPQTA
ncbi:MAG TPA: GGDEF domain-containing protein, partial [Trueperaceae bacterium]|nr:GGDEF domain-containing protein [Trueperaceae bacterium]